MDAARGASFAADQDEGSQRGSGRPIPPLVSKIQVTSTNAGARAQGGLTPDFLALSIAIFKNEFLGRPMCSEGFENRALQVAWGILTHNLWVLAEKLREQRRLQEQKLRQAA